jgi:Na+/glutamate symporter
VKRRDALVVRVFAGWTFFVWAVLVRNMLRDHDHSVGFRAVHIGLALVSFALAAASWAAVNRARRD